MNAPCTLLQAVRYFSKQAPALGKNRATPREIRLAQRRMWFRYWECFHVMNQRGIEEPLCEPEAAKGGE